MPKITEQFIVTVTSDKPIDSLCDHVANRLWSLDHVTSVTASKFTMPHAVEVTVMPFAEARAENLRRFNMLNSPEFEKAARQAMEGKQDKPHFSGFVQTVGAQPETLKFAEEDTRI